VTLDPNCIFCKIIEDEIPADIVFRNENVVAFNDLNPVAPTHVLLIPTLHTENAVGVARNSATITADLFLAADQIATERGLNGYRTVFNTGADAGQSVFHAHLHLLGGRPMAWPPG
jgi:histidine triad (HIT) family protein